MRTRTGWLALLLTAGMTLAPNAVRGQLFQGIGAVPPADPPPLLPYVIGGQQFMGSAPVPPADPLPLVPNVNGGQQFSGSARVPPEAPSQTLPYVARGQRFAGGDDVPPEDPPTFLPLYHDRPETGGFFAAIEFLWFLQTNPIGNQTVTVRGFVDVDGSIQNFINLVQNNPNAVASPGTFFGSHLEALNTNQVGGPDTFVPGFALTAGWRFGDGISLEFTWRHLQDVKYNAVATGATPNSAFPGISINPETSQLADTFLYSPVFNFPPEFSGPISKITIVGQTPNGNISGANFSTTLTVGAGGSVNSSTGPTGNDTASNITGPIAAMILAAVQNRGNAAVPGAAYGIWNGATVETETFVQRHDEYDLIGRIPIYQGDYCRCYGLAGGRISMIWERYQWTTFDYPASNASLSTATLNLNEFIGHAIGQPASSSSLEVLLSETAGVPVTNLFGTGPDPSDVAVYSNIVSNRMYGPMVGCGSEWYFGHGFSGSVDLRAGLLADFVKAEAKYERIDRVISNHRTLRLLTAVPELDALFNLWWYPVEGVQCRVGYDFFSYFDTVSAPTPVSFNYGALDPPWDKYTFRLIQGLSIGIGFIF